MNQELKDKMKGRAFRHTLIMLLVVAAIITFIVVCGIMFIASKTPINQ